MQSQALQDSFRDGSFTYSLAVQPGQSTSAIEAFLFENRVGYCEQFAGAFAAMARAVGLPARVAVGFTPGQPDPLTPGRYVVRGENAHAWPEVYLAGIGWVGFEPTPGEVWPGVSTFHRSADSSIIRIATANFGPGDNFCAIWHIFDMLKDGAAGWEPKYTY